jgi:hypothetical protein
VFGLIILKPMVILISLLIIVAIFVHTFRTFNSEKYKHYKFELLKIFKIEIDK